jgi:hypothetical protein
MLDTRLDWKAIEAAANRHAGPGQTSPVSDLFDPPDPRTRLWRLLDLRAAQDDATETAANVKALFDDILDVFRDHPEANRWFHEWRAAHPGAKLA